MWIVLKRGGLVYGEAFVRHINIIIILIGVVTPMVMLALIVQLLVMTRYIYHEDYAKLKDFSDIFFSYMCKVSCAVSILWVLSSFHVSQTTGISMAPYIFDGSIQVIQNRGYRVKRGDIVVLHNGGTDMIKRVIGMGGEEVYISTGEVYINWTMLDERDYIKPENRDYHAEHEVIVPEGHYFLMGDNRKISDDSRHWGALPESQVFGKVVFNFGPIQRYFLEKRGKAVIDH